VRLINDVLDFEKIESRMMTYTLAVQPLALLVDQAIHATQHFARKYDLQIEFERRIDSVNVNVDADRVIQVMVNLLSNAVKFSARGSKVLVRMAVIGQKTRVSVIDRGMGIPKEFRDQIFTRFSQVDSSDRRQKGGTGLGLCICKSIVEEHSGHIDFISTLGVGSEFYLDLPLVI
jgi:signal transduction histidine kinase